MPPTRGGSGASHQHDGPPRRTVKHVHPLPKGAACIPCAARRVRCSGERPACAACVRHARWNGKNPKKNHGCSYKPSIEDEEEEHGDDQKELQAAKSRISELEQRIVELEGRLPYERRSSVGSNTFASPFGTDSAPLHLPLHHDPSASSTSFINPLPSPNMSTDPTPSPTLTSCHSDLSGYSTSIAPSSLSYPVPSHTNEAHTDPSFGFPFFAFTPPPSADVSPTPSYYDVPTTFSELLSLPLAADLEDVNLAHTTMVTTRPSSMSEVKAEREVRGGWDDSYGRDEGNDDLNNGKSLSSSFGW